MIINFEKSYIKVGRHKISLAKGDYILDNGACLQFIPNEKHKRENYLHFVLYYFVPWKVSKSEMRRLIQKYKFEIEEVEEHGSTITKYFYKGIYI